jgi:hypothetical protein
MVTNLRSRNVKIKCENVLTSSIVVCSLGLVVHGGICIRITGFRSQKSWISIGNASDTSDVLR